MNALAARIFLVDDEPDLTRGLCALLDSAQRPTEVFKAGADFLLRLEDYDGPVCTVLDLRPSGSSGLELMEQALVRRPDMPIIFLSAPNDVPSAVRAMKLGAFDVLQKPFKPQPFLECVNRALRLAQDRHAEWQRQRIDTESLSRLSSREREVVQLMLEGRSSKEMGRALAISPKTVDVHRANVLRKLGMSTARELASRFRMARLPREP